MVYHSYCVNEYTPYIYYIMDDRALEYSIEGLNLKAISSDKHLCYNPGRQHAYDKFFFNEHAYEKIRESLSMYSKPCTQ